MDISVVIPTCDRRAWIGQALDSVRQQTLQPVEVIVVDDGSTDDTTGFIRQRHPWVRLLTQGNHGVSHARNRGIEAARGEWIAFLDSDDTWQPEKLARQSVRLTERGAPPVCHTDEIWIRNGRRVNPMHKHAKPEGWILRHCLPLCCVSPSSALIQREVFQKVGLFDETLPACEDYDLWLRIFSRYPAALAPEPLVVKHGGHPDQLSRRYWGMDRFRIRALCKLLDSGVPRPGDRQAVLATLAEKIDIFALGARKRGRLEQVRRYASLREKYLKDPAA
ncbi:MAG: glycosyltransferase family A protein [Pseudomonadota bacterium]|nr:glycosyltransferase family A protein [Pseudomonadota bacterium]